MPLRCRIYGKKCLGCSERIGPDELVMRALDSVFHLRCFVCVVCGARLQKGDQFVIKQGQLFCRPDYEKEVDMLQGYSHGRSQYLNSSAYPTMRRRWSCYRATVMVGLIISTVLQTLL